MKDSPDIGFWAVVLIIGVIVLEEILKYYNKVKSTFWHSWPFGEGEEGDDD